MFDETVVEPMWVLFWMLVDQTDHFVICDDEQEARNKFEDLVKSTDDLACAGIGPINVSTEHWHG